MAFSILTKINQEPLERRFPGIGHYVAWKLQFRKKNVIKLLSVSDKGVRGRVFKAVELHTASARLEGILCIPRGEAIKPIQLLTS